VLISGKNPAKRCEPTISRCFNPDFIDKLQKFFYPINRHSSGRRESRSQRKAGLVARVDRGQDSHLSPGGIAGRDSA
jgi:hypothetical protein